MAVYKKTYRPYDGALTASWSALAGHPAVRLRRSAPLAVSDHLLHRQLHLPADLRADHLRAAQRQRARPARRAGRRTRLISINVTFFMTLLGWQSMLALFLASFIGPGQVSPDLANNALALYLARPFSRTEYVLGKMSVLLILLSLMTWVPGLLLFGLQGYLEGWQWMHDNIRFAVRNLFRRLDLDSDPVAAGAGALGMGEMEARRRRADVRRLLRGRPASARRSTACSAPTGATCSTSAI